MALVLSLSTTVSAQAGTKYCQDVGSGEVTISGNKIEIQTRGLGETDGTLSFQKMQKSEVDTYFVGIYSDYLRVPVASGTTYKGQMISGGEKFPAVLYFLNTEKDQLGRSQQILLLSVADSPPTMIGVDANCK